MVVIADTSPISGLIIIERLDLLHSIFDEILIPKRVFDEVRQLESFGIDLRKFDAAGWIITQEIENLSVYSELTKELDRGESEAIALSLKYEGSLLLIDERKGRLVAESLNISCIGLIGVLLLAKEKGFLKLIKPVLDELVKEANFWISAGVYRSALKAANE